MKYLKLIIIIYLSLLPLGVKADSCSYKEQLNLSKQAQNIKIKYEMQKDYPLKDNDNYLSGEDNKFYKGLYFKIMVLNIPDNFYIDVSNNYNEEILVLDVKNFIFDSFTVKEMITYKFNVYSSKCPNTKLAIKTITTPKYNPYSKSRYCHNKEDLKECNLFYNGNLSYDKFIEAIDAYSVKNLKSQKPKIKILLLIQKYIVLFIVVILIIFTFLITLIFRRKKYDK